LGSSWKENCKTLGIDIEALPWITTEQEKKRIRLYWNGGIFVYRRSTDYAKHYLQSCIQLLKACQFFKLPGFAFGCNEQRSVALTMVKMGLSWRALPFSHDYIMNNLTHEEWYNEEQLREAKVVHYHGSMGPDFWHEFIKCLRATHPTVADWLAPMGPLKNEAPFYCRSMAKILKYYRSKQQESYKELCTLI
jgi:hypothetical protein